MHVYDTKLVPGSGNSGIEDALAAHADGIVIEGNTCPQNEQGLKQAKADHVPVVGIDSLDCNDPILGGSGPSYLLPLLRTPRYSTTDAFMRSEGQLQADELLASLGSKANIIEFKSSDVPSFDLVTDGFEAELRSLCPSCKLTVVPWTLPDLVSGQLKTKAQDALTADPSANGVETPGDAPIALVIGPVLQASGRRDAILSVGAQGLASNITAARAGQWEDGGAGEPFAWDGWAAIDELNRAFANQPPAYEGIGIRLWSVTPKRVNLPPSGQSYQPGANFTAAYERIWGGS